MNDLTFYTDRTSIETDWECGRKRFWRQHYGGRGITPVEEAVYYLQGRQIHHDLAQLSLGVPIERVLEEMGPMPTDNQDAFEAHSRRQGWAVAWAEYMWPQLGQYYDVLMVEEEVVLKRPPLIVATTADIVWRDRRDGKIVVPDFKTVGLLNKGWGDHWPYAIQQHLNPKAVEEHFGEKPKFGIIIGLLKGDKRDGKQRHPYVWAYSDGGDGWSADYVRKDTWGLRPVFEYPGGVPAWVRHLGKDVALGQFPLSAPIFVDERLLDTLITQRTTRELEVAAALPEAFTNLALRDRVFPHRFSRCRPVIGGICPFFSACHNAVVEADPIASGLYVPRVPHHPSELEIREEEE